MLTRLRLDLPDTDRLDDEAHLDRRFELPVARTFHLQGTVRGGRGSGGRAPASACRDDLVAIDGDPVPVRIQPTDAGGDAGELTSCAPRGRSAPGATASPPRLVPRRGWDVDQLVLSSGRDGEPADVAPRGAPSELAPPVTATSASSSSVEAEIDSDGTPFWFVLGQSAGDGWAVEADGASVGQRTLVDGYANGWVLTPDGPGPVTVRLRWEPQRLVWAGLAASGVAVLACLVIVVRRRPRAEPSLVAVPGLRSPLAAETRSWGVVALAAGLAGGMALVVATPEVAIAVSLLTVIAGLVPRGRVVLLIAAPGGADRQPGAGRATVAGVGGRGGAGRRPAAQPLGGGLVGVTSTMSSGVVRRRRHSV